MERPVFDEEPACSLWFTDRKACGLIDKGRSIFTLCAHKLHGEPCSFSRTYRIIELLDSPRESGDRKYYYRGNAMGDAIVLYAKVAQPRHRHRPYR